MFTDIRRICENPTDEDRAVVPRHRRHATGCKTLDYAMRNFKDESFIGQYLSPQADARLPPVRGRSTTSTESELEVAAIHDDAGYRRRARGAVAPVRPRAAREPNIQVWNVNLRGDRSLTLRHTQHNDRPLDDGAQEVLKHVARLWGFGVRLESVDQWGDVSSHWSIAAPETPHLTVASPTGAPPHPALREGGTALRAARSRATARRSSPGS